MLIRTRAIAAMLCLICSVAAAQEWQAYYRPPAQVHEIDAQSVLADEGKVFFTYRERWPGIQSNGLERPIRAVVDCAARKRSDVEYGKSYNWRDIYPGTGQSAQADLACRLAGLTSGGSAGPAAGGTQRPLKVAFVYVGPVGDGGWTFAHDAGRRAMQAQLAGRVEVSWVERVPEGDAAAPLFQRLIDEGHSLIFATAFGYQQPVSKAAAENPRVRFEQVNGYKPARNVRTYDVRADEGLYLAGVLAGRMTRANILGFVASVPIPEQVRNINAFTLGARSVNPKVRVQVSWVGEWFNPSKESQAARDLMAAGADILMQNTDSSEVVATAQRMGKRAIGWDSDMSAYGQKAHLASVVMNWGPYYVKAVRDALDGSWSGGRIKWGVREDAVRLQSLGADVPAAVRQQLAALTADIASQSLQIWRGPIATNQGRLMVEPDSVVDEEKLERMYFLVDGVDGKLPARN